MSELVMSEPSSEQTCDQIRELVIISTHKPSGPLRTGSYDDGGSEKAGGLLISRASPTQWVPHFSPILGESLP